MKKLLMITTLTIVALYLTACGAGPGGSASSSSSGSPQSNSGSSGLSNPPPLQGTQSSGPSALQLAAGMIKLDGTSNAVTSQQAAQLLPLWQSLQTIENTPSTQTTPQVTPQGSPPDSPQGNFGGRFNPAMMQQIGAQVVLIQNAMTPAQIQAITAMNLSRQDISTAFQQVGISMGGGFNSSGGTFTPPNGTPRAPGTPGAFQGGGGFGGGGGRPGFGSFIPPSVVDGIVQYLQKKAGS